MPSEPLTSGSQTRDADASLSAAENQTSQRQLGGSVELSKPRSDEPMFGYCTWGICPTCVGEGILRDRPQQPTCPDCRGDRLVRIWTHHYLSTYCAHDLHGDCRLTCKHCKAACLCFCHQQSGRALIVGHHSKTEQGNVAMDDEDPRWTQSGSGVECD